MPGHDRPVVSLCKKAACETSLLWRVTLQSPDKKIWVDMGLCPSWCCCRVRGVIFKIRCLLNEEGTTSSSRRNFSNCFKTVLIGATRERNTRHLEGLQREPDVPLSSSSQFVLKMCVQGWGGGGVLCHSLQVDFALELMSLMSYVHSNSCVTLPAALFCPPALHASAFFVAVCVHVCECMCGWVGGCASGGYGGQINNRCDLS